MFKFFDFLINLISTIWDFILGSITFVLEFFMFLFQGLNFGMSIFSALPAFAIGFFTIVLGISVVSLILGNFIDW